MQGLAREPCEVTAWTKSLSTTFSFELEVLEEDCETVTALIHDNE